MTLEKLIRVSGILAILAGVLRIVASLLPESLSTNELLEIYYTIIDILILFASLGLYLFEQYKSGMVGLLGFVLLIIGCSVLIGPNESKNGINYYFIGVKVYSIGLLLFAIDSWIVKKFSKWPPIFWIVSIVIGLVGLVVGYFTTLFSISGILFGLAFIKAGTEIWLCQPQQTSVHMKG